MTSEVVIQAHGLTKHFGGLEAVAGIDFEVERGTCVGLLGPNGAGKTTTMRMIMGLTRPSAGTLTVFGHPSSALGKAERARIGLVPQEDTLDPDITVAQNLHVYGRYFGVARAALDERVPQLLAFMHLEEKANAQVMQLSGGMKRRLIVARALIGNPDLVILDEPTTGLDPQARMMIWKRLLALRGERKTLLLTTHYMDEAERLCDRIVIIDGGRILENGSPRALIRKHVSGHVFELPKPVPEGLDGDGLDVEDIGDAVLVYVDTPEALMHRLGGEAAFHHRPAGLEDVFLRLTGRQLRDS